MLKKCNKRQIRISNIFTPLSNDVIFYASPNGDVRVEVFFQEETFWLSQKKIGELFGVESNTITYHLKEIYQSDELQLEATTRKIRVVQKEGAREVSREVDFYNLDAIIAIGLCTISNPPIVKLFVINVSHRILYY